MPEHAGKNAHKPPRPSSRIRGGFVSSAACCAAIRAQLLGWYERARRDLPWRRTADPYRIWVSEIMLQQTTVKVVVPRYLAFLERFPDLSALAAAAEEDVLAAWSGLGYYARGRALHRAARIVHAEHGGRIPADSEALRALPGIGRYTAAAILSIAFGRREPLVDGNVARVLARLAGMAAARSGGKAGASAEALWDLAARLVPPRRPGDFNQALMELGALVCTPRGPACERCPLAKECAAFRLGLADRIPAPRRAAPPKRVVLAGILVRRRGRILLVRRGPEERLLKGLWFLPAVELERTAAPAAARLARAAAQLAGVSVAVEAAPLAEVAHTITCHRIRFQLFEGRLTGQLPRPRALAAGAARWVRPEEIAGLPVPSLLTKALTAAARAPGEHRTAVSP